MKTLKKAANIAIIAPSGALATEYLARGTYQLRAAGYKVTIMPHVSGPAESVFSASDEARAADLTEALLRNDIDVIWCARGGYGAVRTLQNIDIELLKNTDKLIVGFSDITAIHAASAKVGKVGVLGPMLKHIALHGVAAPDVDATFRLLAGEEVVVREKPLVGSRQGAAVGRLLGGNLSIIYSLRGTPIEPDMNGAILFIEDLCEYRYHLDRMMQNLKFSGILKNLSGLIVGQLTGMKDGATKFGQDEYQIIAAAVSEYNYPVWLGFPSGHDPEVNYPLLIGSQVALTVADSQASLKMKI